MSVTLIGTCLITFILPILTLNYLVFIVWRKGQKQMQDVMSVCAASSYFRQSSLYYVEKRAVNIAEFEAGVWFIVTHRNNQY